jgi:hypothetical protein
MAGKSLEQLNLTDAPLTSPSATDPRDEPWYQLLQEIEEMIESCQYEWAGQTLKGIASTVELTKRVTGSQEAAVRNIRNSRSRQVGRSSRRYEGFGGR